MKSIVVTRFSRLAITLLAAVVMRIIPALQARVAYEIEERVMERKFSETSTCDQHCQTGKTRSNQASCTNYCKSTYKANEGECEIIKATWMAPPSAKCMCINLYKRTVERKVIPKCERTCRVEMMEDCNQCCNNASKTVGYCQKSFIFGPEVCKCKFIGEYKRVPVRGTKTARGPTSQKRNTFRISPAKSVRKRNLRRS